MVLLGRHVVNRFVAVVRWCRPLRIKDRVERRSDARSRREMPRWQVRASVRKQRDLRGLAADPSNLIFCVRWVPASPDSPCARLSSRGHPCATFSAPRLQSVQAGLPLRLGVDSTATMERLLPGRLTHTSTPESSCVLNEIDWSIVSALSRAGQLRFLEAKRRQPKTSSGRERAQQRR